MDTQNKKTLKILAKYEGGSKSYGLATPKSDTDIRFLFIHTDYKKIIGLERHEHECRQNEHEDSFGFEIRHFFNLLRRGNTQCLEMLFNYKWLEVADEFLNQIQVNRHDLIDSHKLYKCLRGYCFSERRLVLGERTGVLGGKRREHLDEFGYSYKNLVQFLRLSAAGSIFFQTGEFPVDINKTEYGDLLFRIKNHPDCYSVEDAKLLMSEYEKILDESYKNIKVVYRYDEDLANKICLNLYLPILNMGNKNYGF